MKPELEHLPLVKNDEKNRFELENNGHLAFIDFEERDSFIALTHTPKRQRNWQEREQPQHW